MGHLDTVLRRCILLLAILLPACGNAESSPHDGPPNVLLLVMDTTRGDRVSVNGYPHPTTPRIAEFAKDAVIFRNAWSPAGWTGPAHASLFTGLRPEHHGYLRGNREYLDRDVPTLAGLLRDAGYVTACLSNNDVLSSESGLLRGFEQRDLRYLDMGRPYPWAPETHEQALEWVDAARKEGKPSFVFVNDMEPHFRYVPPPRFQERFVPPGPASPLIAVARNMNATALFAHNLGASRIPPQQIRWMSALYDAEIACLDDAIGRLLDGYRARGILDNTIVVIVGDHGENLGEHGLVDHMFSLHRTVRHVPLVVRYPPRYSGGRVVEDVVRLEDVFPTLLELAGIDNPADGDGASLRRDLAGRVARASLGPPTEFLNRVGPRLKPGDDLAFFRVRMRAVFDGRHHLIRYSNGHEELFDVPRDPLESVNLARRPEKYAKELERLRKLIPMK